MPPRLPEMCLCRIKDPAPSNFGLTSEEVFGASGHRIGHGNHLSVARLHAAGKGLHHEKTRRGARRVEDAFLTVRALAELFERPQAAKQIGAIDL